MASYYYTDEESLLQKITVLQALVAEQKLRGSPCPLMLSQLGELKVFTDKLSQLTADMINVTEKHLEAHES